MQNEPTLEVTIEQLGGLGDGIGKVGGKPIYVPFTLPGDKVRVRTLHEKSDHIEAELLEVITPSPDRGTPVCKHFSKCGGCQLQHLTPQDYKNFKQQRVAQALRAAGYDDTALQPLISFSASARRRVTFHCQKNTFGFYASRSHTLVPIEECHVLAPSLAALIAPIGALLKKIPTEPALKSLSLTLAGKQIAMEIKAAAQPPRPMRDAVISFAETHGVTRVSWEANERVVTLIETTPLTVLLGGVEVRLPEGAFLQASEEAEAAILNLVSSALEEKKKVVEFFSGLGTYTLPLAEKGIKIEAYEGAGTMVESLGKAAKAAQLPIRASVRDLMKNPLPAREITAFDAALINPPRPGAITQIKEIATSGVPLVVMVSCNPATFARDAKALKNAGYKLLSATAVDQFQWSPHIETVATFAL